MTGSSESPETPPGGAALPVADRMRTPRARLLADTVARRLVTGGGLAIIASVLGILAFILIEVAPLIRGASVAVAESIDLPFDVAGAVVVDEYRTHIAALGRDGFVRFYRKSDGSVVEERACVSSRDGTETGVPLTGAALVPGTQVFEGATRDGRVVLVSAGFTTRYDDTLHRVVAPSLGEPTVFDVDPSGRAVGAFAGRSGEDGAAVVAQIEDGSLVAIRESVRRNAMTGETSREAARMTLASPGARLTALVLDGQAQEAFAGDERGRILHWRLSENDASFEAFDGSSAVTALTFLIGDRSLVVGRADGSLEVWFQTRSGEDGGWRLERVRSFPAHTAAIRAIAPSLRDKGFFVLDDGGGLGLYYSTSERTLWTGKAPIPAASGIVLAPKGDAAYVAGGPKVVALDIRNAHPETSLRALFGKVWYENHERPEYVWQSTGGTDDFESKLSLTPLVYGTFKATFYSLLLAIPLGVLGAMYTSQFMHPRLKRFVKPTVEIMAALPSVVLGFLAGLWLAPLVERHFAALLLLGPALVVAVLVAGLAWRTTPRAFRNRIPDGAEVLLYAVAILTAGGVAFALGPAFSETAFGGSFPQWLLDATGLRYDQRNAIIVGIAMGFAVIPIIFAIAEDAFSNVPLNLVSGSLALGANRWQTVTRVVLPTASPGIFSAIMIGFGRAVGETMIVLMATGNTPIMSASPFDGFRTLSANIAVEIAEAPMGGTLYRTLFLAALLLFLVTFAVNTVAEIVRQRLRRRYAQL